MRDSTTLLRTQCDALRGLPPEQFKAAVLAIWDYELDGTQTQSDPVAMMALGMVKPLIDKREKRSASGKLGAEKRWQTDGNDMATDSKSIANEWQTDSKSMPKEERRKKKEENIKDKKICGHFVPPTEQEVRDYISEKQYQVDAGRFIDFYESKGWMIGKNKMKDWKAAVRTWARSQREESTAKGYTGSSGTRNFDNFTPSGTDWDAVADQLFANC